MNSMENFPKNTNSRKTVKILRMREAVYTRPFFPPTLLINLWEGPGYEATSAYDYVVGNVVKRLMKAHCPAR